MPSAWVIMSVGIIIISFIVGIGFYYLISPLSTSTKKEQLEQVLSYSINLVIYIWIGKVLVNIQAFMNDPLAVLAYPSNSGALYIAICLLAVNVLYKVWKSDFDVNWWLQAFVPVLLASSFTYEFIQLVQKQSTYRLSYLILLMALLVVFILLQERVRASILPSLLLVTWAAGLCGLSFFLPYITIFGYTIHSWFSLVLFVAFVCLGYYIYRKQVS